MTTESRRKAQAKYLASAKGRAARKRAQDRYNHSRRGRASRAKYFKTCKGKEALAIYKRNAAILR